MYQYYVVEIKENTIGEFEHQTYWLWDESEKKAELKGEAKYHEIMATAAISEYPHHSAILFSSEATPIMFGHYDHTTEAE